MSGNPRAPVKRAGAKVPDPLMMEFLGEFAQRFGADPGSFLSEVSSALKLREAVSHGFHPVKSNYPAPSRAARLASEVIEKAARRFIAAREAAITARLEVEAAQLGADLQTGRSSYQDEIGLREAADLLDRSAERVRQLVVREHRFGGRQSPGGRREWHVSRASVIEYRDQEVKERAPVSAGRCA